MLRKRPFLGIFMHLAAHFSSLPFPKATVIFISVSRHISPRKATLLNEKKKIIPPPKKKNPNTLTQHLVTVGGSHYPLVTGTQKYRLLLQVLVGIIHISVSSPRQSPSLAVRCALAPALECEHTPPSQSILGTQDVQTGLR